MKTFETALPRPPFMNYGNGNRNPVYGGPGYGNYMRSHNVNPHKAENHPEFKQVMDRATLMDKIELPAHYSNKLSTKTRKVDGPLKSIRDVELTEEQV